MLKFRRKFHKVLRNQGGFTLVELLVVVAIITILAAVLLPKLLGYTDKARVSRTMGDLAAMRTVIEAYAAGEGKGYYPGMVPDSNHQCDPNEPTGIAYVLRSKGIKWGGEDGIRDPWGMSYAYGTIKVDGVIDRAYLLVSSGPDKVRDTDDDIWCSDSSTPVQGPLPKPNGTIPWDG